MAMGFWESLFGGTDSDEEAEEAAWQEESNPVDNSDTSGNVPDEDD